MALKGLDIFKLSPKKNCKECGCPTCMAFSMKAAQGSIDLHACPYFAEDALQKISEASAPPMKTIHCGVDEEEIMLGGETVLFRHEKTFVNKTRYAVSLCNNMDELEIKKKLEDIASVDYERIGERVFIDMLYVDYVEDGGYSYIELVKKTLKLGKVVILGCVDVQVAKEALAVCKDKKPILNGADASNYQEMSILAKEMGVVLGVRGKDAGEIYDTVAAIEKLDNKNLVMDLTGKSVKDTFEMAVQFRRGAIKDGNRTCGYPSIIRLAALAKGDRYLQSGLAALFTMKYGSVLVMEQMTYAEALPLFGLRQNIFTDPQRPMKVEPGIYPLNGADENSVCLTTVDFALTYFIVSGELERSGIPCNLIISDAGGFSVLTAWAAGKLSAASLSKFFMENNIENQVKSRKLIIPGKVAVLKKEIEEKLPDWEVIIAPNEAAQLVRFMQDYA